MTDQRNERGANGSASVRMSFRSTTRHLEKLMTIAKKKGWVSKKGHANVSAVLNHIIERYKEK